MTPSQEHLARTLDRIADVLGATPEQHATFQKWAQQHLQMLVNAEKEGRQQLKWQATEFRQEYLELQKELQAGIVVTGRTELLRAARKEWLQAILELVDDLLSDNEAAA
jgi:hypothetical protein